MYDDDNIRRGFLDYLIIVEGSRKARLRALDRDGHRCVYCGRKAKTVDHVQPKSLGGPNTVKNLVAACHKCNNARGNRPLTDAELELAVRAIFGPAPR